MDAGAAVYLSIITISVSVIVVVLLNELLRRAKGQRSGGGTSPAEPAGNNRPNPV
jgi:hypothetical protein